VKVPMVAKRNSLVYAVACLACTSCLVIAPACGNPNAAANGGQEPKIRTTVSLVLVDALVKDKKSGAAIDDLTQEDFLLRDDGKPIELARFNRGKDHTLRPVQVWFVLLCNEELHFPMGVQRRTEIKGTEHWGVNFLAGKMGELLPALAHLKEEETIGVAHWCDNGESEIDLAPSRDRTAVLETMEQIARRKTIIEQNRSPGGPSQEVTGLISNVARTGFPEPLPAIIFIGGRQTEGVGGRSGDVWSGVMEESSVDFGVEGGGASGSAESLEYRVGESDYVNRLGVYLDSLHRRYEFAFVPRKHGKELHHVSVALTKAAKEKYPNAVLRYREVYGDEDRTEPEVARVIDWKNRR